MADRVSVQQAADLLLAQNDIGILIHRSPDGDAVGSGYALAHALRSLGKRVRVLCADEIPAIFGYLDLTGDDITPQWFCAVDVAAPHLLGSLEPYAAKVALSIDHHGTNTGYAGSLLLDEKCGAAAMLVFRLLSQMGVTLNTAMAECLYTGLATDTGCFKYSNTDSSTLRMAADLLEYGVRSAMINRLMFDTISRAFIELERLAFDGIRYEFGGKVAIMTVTQEMIRQSGASESDLEGIKPLPRQIEGVWVGITLRQKSDGNYKVSVRSGSEANASAICALLGGGGHPAASGCEPSGTAEEVIAQMLAAIKTTVPEIEETV